MAVGVEDLINFLTDHLDEVGVMFGRFAHQAGFHLDPIQVLDTHEGSRSIAPQMTFR